MIAFGRHLVWRVVSRRGGARRRSILWKPFISSLYELLSKLLKGWRIIRISWCSSCLYSIKFIWIIWNQNKSPQEKPPSASNKTTRRNSLITRGVEAAAYSYYSTYYYDCMMQSIYESTARAREYKGILYENVYYHYLTTPWALKLFRI